jgi:hypothetical protein
VGHENKKMCADYHEDEGLIHRCIANWAYVRGVRAARVYRAVRAKLQSRDYAVQYHTVVAPVGGICRAVLQIECIVGLQIADRGTFESQKY